MAKHTHEHTIQCGITPVERVYVKPSGGGKFMAGAEVIVGGLHLGDVYQPNMGSRKGKWIAHNSINSRVRPTEHKTAVAAVKALVCGQIRSERTSRKLPY